MSNNLRPKYGCRRISLEHIIVMPSSRSDIHSRYKIRASFSNTIYVLSSLEAISHSNGLIYCRSSLPNPLPIQIQKYMGRQKNKNSAGCKLVSYYWFIVVSSSTSPSCVCIAIFSKPRQSILHFFLFSIFNHYVLLNVCYLHQISEKRTTNTTTFHVEDLQKLAFLFQLPSRWKFLCTDGDTVGLLFHS